MVATTTIEQKESTYDSHSFKKREKCQGLLGIWPAALLNKRQAKEKSRCWSPVSSNPLSKQMSQDHNGKSCIEFAPGLRTPSPPAAFAQPPTQSHRHAPQPRSQCGPITFRQCIPTAVGAPVRVTPPAAIRKLSPIRPHPATAAAAQASPSPAPRRPPRAIRVCRGRPWCGAAAYPMVDGGYDDSTTYVAIIASNTPSCTMQTHLLQPAIWLICASPRPQILPRLGLRL